MADKKKMALAVAASSLVLLSGAVQAEEVPSEQVQEEEALSYSDLGSGEEVRSNLVTQTNRGESGQQSKQPSSRNKRTAEGKCGSNSGSNSEKPPAEGQCGQGSCGSSGSNGTNPAPKKPAQGQCGQGTCGSSGSGSGPTGASTSSNQKAKSKVSTGH